MGICLSCLRGRDSDKGSTRRRTDESQPLLDESNEWSGAQFGSTDGQADQLAQRRQQELSQVVQLTHEYFIDVSSMAHPENAEAAVDVSALRECVTKSAAAFAIEPPQLRELTPDERELLQKGTAGLDAERRSSLTPTTSQRSQRSASRAEPQSAHA